jgi:hypothetical protein
LDLKAQEVRLCKKYIMVNNYNWSLINRGDKTMDRFIKVLMFLALCLFLIADSAIAVTFGDGGAALQAALDSITVAPWGDSSIDVTTDE